MNKRGMELLLGTALEFIMIILIIGFVVLIIAKEQSSTKFEKLYQAQDIGMFIDTLYASPNKIIVRYPENTQNNAYLFEKNLVTVYKTDEGVSLGEFYSFNEESDVEFEYNQLESVFEYTAGENIIELSAPLIFTKTRSRIVPELGILSEEVLE